MNTQRFISIMLLAVLILPANCNDEAFGEDVKTPIVVSLAADRTSGKMSDSIFLTITIKNVSNSPIFLYGKLTWGLSSSLFLFVEDDKGKDIPMSFLEDALPPTPSPKDKTLFIKLNPEHFFGTTRTDKLSDLAPHAGTYYLSVMYHGAISKRFAGGSPAWGTEDPPIMSNKVKIDVQ